MLALPADEDKLQAAAQLIVGAHAIYDGSVTAISGSQVTPCPALMAFSHHSHPSFTGLGHHVVSQAMSRQETQAEQPCNFHVHEQNNLPPTLVDHVV